MKLEKEVKINNIYSDIKFPNNKRSCCFNCIVCGGITEDELKILKECKEKIKLTLEIQQPILDEEERNYLSGVIRPFKNRVEYITKMSETKNTSYIKMGIKGSYYYMILPCFNTNMMYKNMELNKEYTLEELGL